MLNLIPSVNQLIPIKTPKPIPAPTTVPIGPLITVPIAAPVNALAAVEPTPIAASPIISPASLVFDALFSIFSFVSLITSHPTAA